MQHAAKTGNVNPYKQENCTTRPNFRAHENLTQQIAHSFRLALPEPADKTHGFQQKADRAPRSVSARISPNGHPRGTGSEKLKL